MLGIEREAFGAFEIAFAEACNAGGVDLAHGLKLRDPQGQRIVFRFGGATPSPKHGSPITAPRW